MDFSNVTDWIIPEGVVTKVTTSDGTVLWKKQTPPVPPIPIDLNVFSKNIEPLKTTTLIFNEDFCSKVTKLEWWHWNGNRTGEWVEVENKDGHPIQTQISEASLDTGMGYYFPTVMKFRCDWDGEVIFSRASGIGDQQVFYVVLV